MKYGKLMDMLFEVHESAFRAGQVSPSAQDLTKVDTTELEDALDVLYKTLDNINESIDLES